MLAILAFIVFVIAAVRDWAATAPTHQTGLLFVGLALVALHLAWDIALPALTARRTTRTTPAP